MTPEKEKSSPGTLRDGERERLRVAVAREPVELGAAGVAEPEQPGALVEGLPDGVVERPAGDRERAARADVEQHRVPAAREQAEKRRVERVGLEVERGDVTVEVVDRRERQPARPGERLRRRDADEQRADRGRAHASRRRGRRRRASRPRRRAPAERPAARARDAAETRSRARRRRTARAGRPATRSTFARISPSCVTSAAAVSSHDVSSARITRPAAAAGRAT